MHLYCLVEEGCLETGPCKVGVADNPSKRISSLQAGNWRPLVFAWIIPLDDRRDALNLEQHVLMCLRPNPYGGGDRERLCSEWVKATPAKAREHADFMIDAMKPEAVA